MSHPRTLLNNELQSLYGQDLGSHVGWEIRSSGPPSSPVWYATIYIDDINHGYAEAPTKGAAKDEAARQAYNNLRRERQAREATTNLKGRS
ncbi:hypothetical protein K503DRAFT_805563 [Rhizopogon vinicolor AM-OR11-026]|uniref:DRBM domain-containing protein n=1 Tax=Rhizopogon vinicolor AM-OR11-026 TaxID=1314800 RepID=A0A1B7MHI1_9AGAM|nr:hypothetical protein K503DRAFT_805563 [Rhizopogon vinicolor AM-OR11-026]